MTRAVDLEAIGAFLAEPRNAIVKQYKASMKLDDVELIFEDELYIM